MMMHNAKTFDEIEVGSVFKHNQKVWQKVTSTTARDVNPVMPVEFEPDTEVESLYEHKDEE
jgi:hypothetical protein|tara:strand:+ start:465 stop:647 length:183 start_codon:yes stop_codon:yes gene_type:complete